MLKKLLNPIQTIPISNPTKPTITWIGHASFLIQFNGFTIITDPIFGDVKVGPFSLTKRAIKPGIELQNIPPVDVIVISHNHSDHLDTPALTYLAKKYNPTIYVPQGNKKLVASIGFTHVIEAMWWDDNIFEKNGKKLHVACLPARHWSIRFSLYSYRASLWASWMLYTEDMHIYFAGNTAYGKTF